MNTVIHRLFAGLLHVYPRDHREVFGAEMEGVFGEVLAEAETNGPMALAAVAIRELISIAGCGLLARLSAPLEDSMNMSTTRRASWLGALAFGLAFALMQWMLFFRSNGGWAGAVAWALATGALGGWLVSLIGEPGTRRLAFAGAGALAFALALAVFALIFWQGEQALAKLPGGLISVVLGEFAVIALTFGALAGLIDGGARLALRFVWVSLMSTLLGAALASGVVIAGWGIVQAYDSWRPGFDGTLSPWVNEASHLLIGLALPAGVGLFFGAAFGRAEAAVRADRVIGKATA